MGREVLEMTLPRYRAKLILTHFSILISLLPTCLADSEDATSARAQLTALISRLSTDSFDRRQDASRKIRDRLQAVDIAVANELRRFPDLKRECSELCECRRRLKSAFVTYSTLETVRSDSEDPEIRHRLDIALGSAQFSTAFLELPHTVQGAAVVPFWRGRFEQLDEGTWLRGRLFSIDGVVAIDLANVRIIWLAIADRKIPSMHGKVVPRLRFGLGKRHGGDGKTFLEWGTFGTKRERDLTTFECLAEQSSKSLQFSVTKAGVHLLDRQIDLSETPTVIYVSGNNGNNRVIAIAEIGSVSELN